MNSTSTKSSYNRVVAYGRVIEKNPKSFHKDGKDYDFLQLVVLCQFHDLYNDRISSQLHVTNVWNPELITICNDIEVGDNVEVESYVESERNKKDPALFYHKMNATKIKKADQ